MYTVEHSRRATKKTIICEKKLGWFEHIYDAVRCEEILVMSVIRIKVSFPVGDKLRSKC